MRRGLRAVTRVLGEAESALDWLRYRRRRPGPFRILPYRGHGTTDTLYVRGRVLSGHPIPPASEDDTAWRNLANTIRRLDSDEVPAARVRATVGEARSETVADEEGYFEFALDARTFTHGREVWRSVRLDLLEPVNEDGTPTSSVARVLVPAAAWLGVGFLLLPHATVLLVSFVPEGTWTTQLFPPSYSFENYRDLFADSQMARPMINSLRMATIATIANVILAVAAAYLLVRRQFTGRAMIGALVILPWALPGTVLAIALSSTFSVHEPLAGGFVLIGTFAILPLAYFIRNIPLVTRAAMGSFRQFDPVLEEAAGSLGASWWYTLRRVTLPLVLPGLAAGAMLAFVTALGEFVASILLYTHRTRPISMAILSELRAFNFGGAAAYGVLLIALMAIVFVLGFRTVNADARGL